MTQSLSEFAAEYRPAHVDVAWLETLPEFDEILAAWRDGTPVGTIREWLVSVKGYEQLDVTDSRVGGLLRRKYPR